MPIHLHSPGVWFPSITAVIMVGMMTHGFVVNLLRARRQQRDHDQSEGR